MKYIDNLIPKKIKVLPDYFKGNVSSQPVAKRPSVVSILTVIIAFIFAVSIFGKFSILLLYLSILIICTKAAKIWIERIGHFILTPVIRFGLCLIIFLLSIPTWLYFQNQEVVKQSFLQAERKRKIEITTDSLKRDSARRDTLSDLLAKSQIKKEHVGLLILDSASKYAVSFSEKASVEQSRKAIIVTIAKKMIRDLKYRTAIEFLSTGITQYPEDTELKVARARCYVKVGSIHLAVKDLSSAKEGGDITAGKLYNKINPIRRRIAYTVTRCCDGSTSSASGRGACSWHGGVCNWNDPVYEEYRRY